MPDRAQVIKGLECCRRGFCFACPYNDGIDDARGCKQALTDDILALLKAQEPRVMTLKELDDLRGCGKAVFYEDREAAAKCEDAFFACWEEGYAWLKAETHYITNRGDYYGVKWRCWTSRPTDAQMEAEKWES